MSSTNSKFEYLRIQYLYSKVSLNDLYNISYVYEGSFNTFSGRRIEHRIYYLFTNNRHRLNSILERVKDTIIGLLINIVGLNTNYVYSPYKDCDSIIIPDICYYLYE